MARCMGKSPQASPAIQHQADLPGYVAMRDSLQLIERTPLSALKSTLILTARVAGDQRAKSELEADNGGLEEAAGSIRKSITAARRAGPQRLACGFNDVSTGRPEVESHSYPQEIKHLH